MGPLTFRHAAAGDAQALSNLLADLGYPATPEDAARRLERFTGQQNATVLVADRDGAVVACAALTQYHPLHTEGPVAHLTAFAVSGHSQRSGIGRAMIAYIESWAKERGCMRIVVTSAERREGAHAFYPAVGWGYTGRRYGKVLSS